MKKVSVVSVNFNQPAVTEAMLASVAATNDYPDIEIIVVDNGSSKDPVPEWRKKYPGIIFIRSDVNLGFAGGNNLALRAATGEYLFLVNNDTEFTPGLIATLAGTLNTNPEVGIVSPKIRYYDKPDTLQYAGFTRMNYYMARTTCIGQFEKDHGQYDDLTGETGYVHGAAMMVRRGAIDKAGEMAELYFLYYEEMDWCEHIKRAGYTVWINMQALIYHKESVTVGSRSALKEYFMNRNRVLFIRRNCPWQVRVVFWPYFILVVGGRNIFSYIKEGRRNFIGVFLKAVTWNFTNSTNSRHLGYKV